MSCAPRLMTLTAYFIYFSFNLKKSSLERARIRQVPKGLTAGVCSTEQVGIRNYVLCAAFHDFDSTYILFISHSNKSPREQSPMKQPSMLGRRGSSARAGKKCLHARINAGVDATPRTHPSLLVLPLCSQGTYDVTADSRGAEFSISRLHPPLECVRRLWQP